MSTDNYPVMENFDYDDTALSACSCPYAITKDGTIRKTTDQSGCLKHLNYCSGANMHFDLGQGVKQLYWGRQEEKLTNAQLVTAGGGFIVRWKKVACDKWEELDTQRSLNNKYSPPVPTDPGSCTVGDWGAWSACTVTCGGGTRSRSRSVTDPGSPGTHCAPATSAKEDCNHDACPADCTVSRWSGWSACSVECGSGVNTRSRQITRAASHQGTPCPSLVESRACTGLPACEGPAPPCVLSDWGMWGACSSNCGSNGERLRTRTAAHCTGATTTQTTPCNRNVPCATPEQPTPSPTPQPSPLPHQGELPGTKKSSSNDKTTIIVICVCVVVLAAAAAGAYVAFK